MSIKSIEIKNFKSIEYLKLDVSEINAFVGKNGAGKTTILEAMSYFYDNLVDINANNKNFDSVNLYKNKLEIMIEYDFSRIRNFSRDSYSMKLFSMLENNLIISDTFKVKLEQEKGEHIKWNIDYPDRYVVYNSHPVYFCNTRSLSLTNWDSIWNVVGDLVNAKDANEISEELIMTLKEKAFVKFNRYTNIFEFFLKTNDLSIDIHSKKEKIISLLQLQLGGKNFNSKEESLDFFSDGTNSQNYILLLSYLAFEISKRRLKDVTVFLDEPELGLHPKMIDEMMGKLVEYSQSINFFVFSHSPRLIAYVLRKQGDLYNVALENAYTVVRKIGKASEEKQKLIITDREASCFFADFLLFVEGVSEVELFSHEVLTTLFPVLKRVDIVNTNSNDHLLKMISPKHSNSAIPYLVLVDLDKLVSFKEEKGEEFKCKFEIKNLWYSPLSNKVIEDNLKYNYSKPESRHYLKTKVEILKLKKQTYSFNGELQIVTEFTPVFKLIHSFCEFNDIYVVSNTIEGVIINSQTNKYINGWRQHEYGKDKNLNKLLRSVKIEEKVVINRLLFSGKTDMLNNYSKETFAEKLNILNEVKTIKKNTYWISSFFDYYDEKILKQKQYTIDFDNKKKISRFKRDFPELYDIIKSIENRISDE